MATDPAGVQLADEIAVQIRARKLQPGVLVASEQELRSRHDIGRSVLRQAVRILEERGVAYMRRGAGGGLIVAPPDPESAGRSLAIVIESRMQGPHGLDLLFKAIDTHAFVTVTPKLELAACERIRRLATRLSGLSNKEFQRVGGIRQMTMAVRGLFNDPLVGLAYQTTAEYGQDLVPYSVLMSGDDFRGGWLDAMLQMVEAQIAGDVAGLFDLRRRQLDMIAESQLAWGVIDRHRRLVPTIEEPSEPQPAELQPAPGQSPAERLTREILRDVRLLDWTPGERIGGAAELMERYQVTVGTLRQAVRILEEHSAVRMERGRNGGLFITAPDAQEAIRRALEYLAQTTVDEGDARLFQRQLVLECLSCIAARRPDAAELRLQVAGAARGPVPTVGLLLGRLSANPALEMFTELLASVAPETPGKDDALLTVMATALADGDGPKARRAYLSYDYGARAV